MKLIDKDAVLAIIEKELSYYKDLEDRGIISDCGVAGYRVVRMLKSDIESLEVKEVDLDKELVNYNRECVDENGFFNTEHLAKHFFELGMQVSNKAQKGE